MAKPEVLSIKNARGGVQVVETKSTDQLMQENGQEPKRRGHTPNGNNRRNEKTWKKWKVTPPSTKQPRV